MQDDLPFERTRDYTLSRRGLAALSLGAVASASAIAADVAETDIVIEMPDGDCDAALFNPAGDGSWPGVVIFADALGLRPAFRDMGRRLAAEGYVVVVPNPFYRTRKAPVLSGPFDFSKAEDRAKLVEQYARGAVKLLECARKVGYFDPVKKANRDDLKGNKNLNPLRQRSDFRELLARLQMS